MSKGKYMVRLTQSMVVTTLEKNHGLSKNINQTIKEALGTSPTRPGKERTMKKRRS